MFALSPFKRYSQSDLDVDFRMDQSEIKISYLTISLYIPWGSRCWRRFPGWRRGSDLYQEEVSRLICQEYCRAVTLEFFDGVCTFWNKDKLVYSWCKEIQYTIFRQIWKISLTSLSVLFMCVCVSVCVSVLQLFAQVIS